MSKQKTASKAILQYLAGSGQVRTERLREAICNPAKRESPSPKMFYKYLSDLVESKRVTKFEFSRNEVYYSMPDWVEYENKITQGTVDHVRTIEKKLEKLVSIPSGLAGTVILNDNIEILHSVYLDIKDMHSWATLAKLRNPKENSAAINNILTGTYPDLMEKFSKVIGKFEKHRVEIIEDLLYMQQHQHEFVQQEGFPQNYKSGKTRNWDSDVWTDI